MPRIRARLCAVAVAAAFSSASAQAAQRVFVASFGSDANTATNCSFATPCRGFTAAMTVVDPGGEVVALDAAGYGAVTITKSVTITANPGFYAGITAAAGNGVTIATAGVIVTLRGLNINGTGGSNGVNVTDGSRLSVENCVISNFTVSGVAVVGATKVRIVDSLIRDNFIGIVLQDGPTATISSTRVLGHTSYGIFVNGFTAATTTSASISDSNSSDNFVGVYLRAPTAGAAAYASVTRSTMSNNSGGLVADNSSGTAIVTINGNMITRNSSGPGVGVFQAAGATVESTGGNTIRQNPTDVTGTITAVAAM